jgi:hypothetical protein
MLCGQVIGVAICLSLMILKLLQRHSTLFDRVDFVENQKAIKQDYIIDTYGRNAVSLLSVYSLVIHH